MGRTEKKDHIPQIRIISVEHDRTSAAEITLRHGMAAHGYAFEIISVYCHLEAARCGVPSGKVGLEVDGALIWRGNELTPKLADEFWSGMDNYLKRVKNGELC